MRKARTEKENAIREKMLSELYANEYNKFIGFELLNQENLIIIN